MKFNFIDISKIDPNPHNPRGIQIAKQDKKLPLLTDSIKNFWILVPLVVVSRGNRYLLIDGERRYVAAKALGLNKVPAYVNEKGLSDNELLYQMFHIHHNREDWGPIPQCRALEPSYNRIRNRKKISEIDFGRPINPKLCISQIQGGIEFGVGFALSEEGLYDSKIGKLLNKNLHQYKMPTSLDMPQIDAFLVESEDPYFAYSAKGAGENTNAPTPAAIRNAIYNAIGIWFNDLPITPDKIIKAVHGKRFSK